MGGTGVISSSKLPLVYHNRLVENLIGEGEWGVGSGVSKSFSLPLVYHNMIVEYLIGEGGGEEWVVG